MSDTSSIVLTGEIMPGHDLDDVVVALARLLKTTEEKALQCLSGKETVIKRNVAEADVAKYLNALSHAGAVARFKPATPVLADLPALASADMVPVLPVEKSSVAPPARAVSAGLSLQPVADQTASPPSEPVPAPAAKALEILETVTCPKCGHEQPKRTLCLQCGCDMPRTRAAQQQEKADERAMKSAFQAPAATLVDQESEEDFVTPGVFSFSMAGRLGRLRYIAYSWAVMVPIAVIGILAAILIPRMSGGATLGFVLLAAVGIVAIWLGIRLAVLRLHDVNRTGKWILLLILLFGLGGATMAPTLIIICTAVFWLGSLALMAWPGSGGSNDYGPPCGPNTPLIVIGAVLILILQVVGLFKAGDTARTYTDRSSGLMSGSGGRSGKAVDFSNPVYAEIRVVQSAAGRELEMVYVGKMASESDCEQHAEAMKASFSSGCKDCLIKASQCKQELSPRYAMLFDNTPMSSTYLSMAAGDASEREGRMVFWGLSVAESTQVCQAMKGFVQKAQKGTVRCIQAEGG